MSAILAVSLLSVAAAAAPSLQPRLQDGLAQTPPMGWNTYNHYSCSPNETIVRSNAKALVDLGLDSLGYRYVTTDCGWSVADRLADGSLTWNPELFPQGFPALGEYIHDLGLLFGVYGDAGILLCGSPPNNTGNLGHEEQDAQRFASWKVDSLKYDNCYSDAATNFPNVNYAPSTSPSSRYATMSQALAQLNRTVLFQVCDWGVDFPALWAPSLGHTWRIGNDIIPAWRTIYRILNQAVPQTDVAGPGQWPDLDMLEVGNGVFSLPEEQTHFSLWAILKSPLVIGAALRDAATAISESSLAVLRQEDVIAFNQDALGTSASLRRRWSEEEYEVWSGPLSGGRTVAALVNWRNESRELTLDLPDIGLQYAGSVKNIWEGSVAEGVRTSYTATVAAHGTMLLELGETIADGVYPGDVFGKTSGTTTTFSPIYALTTSKNYSLTITLSKPLSSPTTILLSTGSNTTTRLTIPASTTNLTTPLSLSASSNATLTLHHPSTPALPIASITLTPPQGTYAPSTTFTLSGTTALTTCGAGYCLPVGSKLGYLSPSGSASTTIHASSAGTKYVEVDYINNDIAFDSSWNEGRNARNLTISVNGGAPVRLEVPLSGRHSELFGPGLGWWDSATLGVSVDGWTVGVNEVVVGNVGGGEGVQSYGADLVGVRVLD
ncbi:putative alpha-galactosidase D [Aspergillus brunneoviolaceus CBS 621.78]|uniref:Alpha-galactosidase D n=1 Tax=Aspergillus brunneoviolaceus CBS 621.78 TaxID=1450534 RepID=A0ACD1GPZ5_9EURO|nr:putative alpha-galactosidase D [Aspergillus brunneoviolaceus CBS 621.78]RAH51250.1 putative alpha-galactosidase D [Aspergillus brunneoviolaceus CBS 621.78]